MRRKKAAIVLIFALILTSFAACASNTEERESEKVSAEKAKRKVGLTFDTLILERWTRDRDVFVATAQKLGAEVDVQNANGDVEKQKQQINKFIEDGVDVIVIVPADCFKIGDEIAEARKRGINVISYDRLVQNTMTDLYITVDNEKVGEEMAHNIMKNLPDGGEVMMICGPESDANSQDVVDGFEKALKKSNLDIARKTNVDSWLPENGVQVVNSIIQATQDVDAIMCGNDALAGLVIQALSEKQLAGRLIVVGQDADLEACQRVVEGTQSMTVYKPIEKQAKQAAECAVRMANGESIKKDLSEENYTVKMTKNGQKVPYLGLVPTAVTRENMDEIIIDSGFHLRDEVYLNIK